MKQLLTVLCLALLAACDKPTMEPEPAVVTGPAEILPGVEVLVRDHGEALAGLRVAILTNPTGVTRDLTSTIDAVRAMPGVDVVRLFSPEHGLRGQHYAGDKVDENRDPVSGLPVMSLYGKTRRPTAEMLEGLDAVLYDIQDVGHRTYTYVSTLTYLMEACEAAGVAVWVLDRPEPMGGRVVGGPMIGPELLSFIGVHPVPQVYGMTPGEWARMIQAERTPDVELKVIRMDGWRRGMTYGETGWIWVPTSQHIPQWTTSYFYAMTGTIGELGKVSVGVGTPTPFELIGQEWLDGVELAGNLNARRLPGVIFRPVSYSPRYALGTGKMLHGVQIHISDYQAVDPPRVLGALISELADAAPDRNLFADYLRKDGSPSGFLKALGDRSIAGALAQNQIPAALVNTDSEAFRAFLERRESYLLYR
ncbi:MAG: DUF1343 domain-containing protein [Xanthomonadales bacterium]|nr:DUF1343 domain-containing protein [Gammaproteobacteria bacterium]MBT8052054.1 DUF1343 domain-containing protein [Gammaproteobacteria bacterium]MBT8056948.1 DUF1343 domain-containing protein [Gammaproteobacteria bacterium]NNJ78466.1 DUF1343 domain-containing protein [Xanthomonadales bacterium]NNL05101.1 DUF1343 domain-containing protein [Xanthomonadales bacterium]